MVELLKKQSWNKHYNQTPIRFCLCFDFEDFTRNSDFNHSPCLILSFLRALAMLCASRSSFSLLLAPNLCNFYVINNSAIMSWLKPCPIKNYHWRRLAPFYKRLWLIWIIRQQLIHCSHFIQKVWSDFFHPCFDI